MMQELSGYWAEIIFDMKPVSWTMFGNGDVTSGVWILHDNTQMETVVAGQRKLIFPDDQQNRNRNWRRFSEAGQSTIEKQIRTGTSSKEHGPS